MLLISKSLLSLRLIPKATIVVVTDRKELDNQLYTRFKNALDYLRIDPKRINTRNNLISELKNKEHSSLYFTTVQKFEEETDVLTLRNDVFVLVDEAHRSQNSIDGQYVLNNKNQEVNIRQGYAYYMRRAFPNAKMIGFTGTPLMKQEKSTVQIFGDYNHKYLMNDSVRDGSTVPIHYEMRLVDIGLNESYLQEMNKIQKAYARTLDETDILSQRKLDELLKTINLKEVMEDEDVIKAKAFDMLKH